MKLTKKSVVTTVIVLVCLLAGIDLAVLENSNLKAGLEKAQGLVGGLLGDDEAPAPVVTEEAAPAAPVATETAE